MRNQILKTAAVFLAGLCAVGSMGISQAESSLNLTALKKQIERSDLARQELINHSSGKVTLTLHNTKGEGFDETHEELKSSYGMKLVPMIGKVQWDVEWQRKDNKNRYDIVMKKPNNEEQFFGTDQNIRNSCDSKIKLNYDVLDKRAYINRPSRPITSPSSLFNNQFNIDYFYSGAISGLGGKTISGYITSQEEKGMLPELSVKDRAGRKTIQIKYTVSVPKNDKTHRMVRLIEVCPEMGYSIVSYEVYNNMGTNFEALKLVSSYEAEYEESKTHSGIWIAKKVKVYAMNRLKEEMLTGEFKEVQIGVDISDNVFTFDGLGVPPGTTVYDKSRGGQPVKSVYEPVHQKWSKKPACLPHGKYGSYAS